jgi:predicted RNA methylase
MVDMSVGKIFLVFCFLLVASCSTSRFVEKHATLGSAQRIKENEAIKENYRYTYEHREFVGFPNVFSPPLFQDNAALDALPVYPGETFLEIGSGTGTLSVLAALRGAKHVVAVDINPDAVANTAENAKRHGVDDKIDTRVSDIYSAIRADEKFDVIFWNIPFCHINRDRKDLSFLEQAAFDPEHKLLERYLAEGQAHLKTRGRLYLGYSTTDGDIDLFHRLAKKYGWQVSLLKKTGDKDAFTVELYELKRVLKASSS